MQLELIIRNADFARILRNYAERRLHFALSRFGDRVDRVTVVVSEPAKAQNGEKDCHIRVDLRPFGQVVAEETDPDVHTAIDRAASRVGRLLGSRLERRQELPRLLSRPEREKPRRQRQSAPVRTPFRSLRQPRAGRSFEHTGHRRPRIAAVEPKNSETGRMRCKSN